MVGTPCLLCTGGAPTPRKELQLQPVCTMCWGTGRKQRHKRRSGKRQWQREMISPLSGRVMPAHSRREMFGWNTVWRHWDSPSHKALGKRRCWQPGGFIRISTCPENEPRGKAVCGPSALGRVANAELFQCKLPGRIPAGNAGLLPERVEMTLGWKVPVRPLALLLLACVQLSRSSRSGGAVSQMYFPGPWEEEGAVGNILRCSAAGTTPSRDTCCRHAAARQSPG